MTHTKEEYQAALKTFNQCVRSYDYEPDIEKILSPYVCDTIRSALQLAIDLQPRPIEDVKIDEDKEDLVFSANHHEWLRRHYDGIWRYDRDMGPKDQPTHYYDLSFLPKPEVKE